MYQQQKVKEDEPMDTGENTAEGNNEEDGTTDEVFWADSKTGGKVLCDPTSYGLLPSSILELRKLSRAKRFGIPIEQGRTALVDTGLISRLYKSLGIDENNEKNYRFNAVHMWGTQNMSNNDVHEYFSQYRTCTIEWINDYSCNVVWKDHFSAAKALLGLSKEIKNLDKIRFNADPFKRDLESDTEEMVVNTDANAVDAREIEGAIPPGQWRLGVPTAKSLTILLRLATKSDKKQGYTEKNSEFYKKYGNPHFGNMPGIVSNSLRNEVIRQNRQRTNNFADYMEDTNNRNPWGSLAQQWGRQDGGVDARSRIKQSRELRLVTSEVRLSLLPKKDAGSESGPSQSGNDNARDKLPKMKMYADEEGKPGTSSGKAGEIPQGSGQRVEDLRVKINRSKKRKQLTQDEIKSKRVRFWNGPAEAQGLGAGEGGLCGSVDRRCAATETTMEGVKIFGYDNDLDSDDDEDDDSDLDIDLDADYDEIEKASSWALENYSDLRDTLRQGKNQKAGNSTRLEQSESNADKDGDHDDEDDEMGDVDVNHRSPLQIEFENDDYFEKESN